MIGGCLVVALLLPLVILNALLRMITRGAIPSLIVGPLDRAIFKPYEVRRVKHEHMVDTTHGFWKRVGDRVAETADARDGRHDRRAARDVRRASASSPPT